MSELSEQYGWDEGGVDEAEEALSNESSIGSPTSSAAKPSPDNTLRNETFRMVLIQELWDSGLIGIPPNASEEQAIANILLAIKTHLSHEELEEMKNALKNV